MKVRSFELATDKCENYSFIPLVLSLQVEPETRSKNLQKKRTEPIFLQNMEVPKLAQ